MMKLRSWLPPIDTDNTDTLIAPGKCRVERHSNVLKPAYEMAALFPDMMEREEPILCRNGLLMLNLDPRPKEAIEPNNFV
jgi:hypothetical protein